MKNSIFIFFLFKSLFLISQNTFNIEGRVSGAKDGVSVELVAFNYAETTISSVKVLDEKIFFNLKKDFNDGVYKVLINYVGKNSIQYSVFQFYLILDKSEDKISFEYNPDKSIYPDILNSNINKDWYDFLKVEDFRISVIDGIKNTIETKSNNSFQSDLNLEELLNKEINELLEVRLGYLNLNYNKWSTAMIKNTYRKLYLINVSKENFWNHFDTKNIDLINTPIYQDIIQVYIMLYYKNADENSYKQGFDEVIRVFSNDSVMREWVVKYVITGLYYLNNNQLISYFSTKYKYKI